MLSTPTRRGPSSTRNPRSSEFAKTSTGCPTRSSGPTSARETSASSEFQAAGAPRLAGRLNARVNAGASPVLFAITDLSVRAGAGWLRPARTILSGVTIALRQGEVLAVLGRSGAGKTVMWRAMFGLSSPGLTVEYGSRVPALSEAGLERWRRSSVVFVHQGAQRSLEPRLSLEAYL